jgi:hypothetical protein
LLYSMIFASYGCRIWSPLSNEDQSLNSESLDELAHSTRHGHVLGYCSFMLFPLTSTVVKDIVKSVPIMGKTTDFEFSYFSAPLGPGEALGSSGQKFSFTRL